LIFVVIGQLFSSGNGSFSENNEFILSLDVSGLYIAIWNTRVVDETSIIPVSSCVDHLQISEEKSEQNGKKRTKCLQNPY
jgi:hypothetical protein